MKVICKNVKLLRVKDNILTIDKIYDTISISMEQFLIIDDSGSKRWYNSNRFISIEEVRDNKLTQLGI